ncbi:MAG TPA: YCF48-related protein, partial [Terriglobales bacterium]|nr:YCF48-related protein [Terriglobales bacterium]
DPEFVSAAGEFGVILVSTDGGRTFQARTSGVETTLFGIFFSDRQRGWAVGMEQSFVETRDGGATWEKKSVKAPPGFSLALFDLEVRGNLGWAVGNSGYLLNSTDAGESWNLIDVPSGMASYWFREVSLLPSGKGFVVGASGLVLSLDGSSFKVHKDEL